MKMMRPPSSLEHGRQVGAREAHARHDVGLKEARPVGVRNLLERLGLEDACVVDQDVDPGTAATSAAQPAAEETSAAIPRTFAPAIGDLISAATVRLSAGAAD